MSEKTKGIWIRPRKSARSHCCWMLQQRWSKYETSFAGCIKVLIRLQGGECCLSSSMEMDEDANVQIQRGFIYNSERMKIKRFSKRQIQYEKIIFYPRRTSIHIQKHFLWWKPSLLDSWQNLKYLRSMYSCLDYLNTYNGPNVPVMVYKRDSPYYICISVTTMYCILQPLRGNCHISCNIRDSNVICAFYDFIACHY